MEGVSGSCPERFPQLFGTPDWMNPDLGCRHPRVTKGRDGGGELAGELVVPSELTPDARPSSRVALEKSHRLRFQASYAERRSRIYLG